MSDEEYWARICKLTGETVEHAKARVLRETQEAHAKHDLPLSLNLNLRYLPDADEYWLQSAGEEFVEVDGGVTTLTDPDGEHPGISMKFSARPGSGNYNYGNYARMAKLADEQGMAHGPVPSAEEVENAPSARLRDRGFFAKCPSCGYTKN